MQAESRLEFRVWIPKQGKIHYVGFCLCEGKVFGIARPSMSDKWPAFQIDEIFPEYTVMQYTGIKDKNGKKIFEGDIIKYQYDSAYPDKFDYSIVQYEEFSTNEWGYQLGGGYDNVEVIGNIFENPELCKSKNLQSSLIR